MPQWSRPAGKTPGGGVESECARCCWLYHLTTGVRDGAPTPTPAAPQITQMAGQEVAGNVLLDKMLGKMMPNLKASDFCTNS